MSTKIPLQAVPTNVITGFLGVGKTTAILNLLKNKPANERWAVLVNEFGEIGVDGSLMQGQYGQETGIFVREVPGGCICCTSGLPMQIALNQLLVKAKPDSIELAHGIAATSFSLHDDRPFKVVGILQATGTPVDQTLHVSLEGIEAIHIDWQHGVKIPNSGLTQSDLEQAQLTPKSITAFMLGLNSKIATFQVQRAINQYTSELVVAILPGVALSELWGMISVLENTLLLVSALIFVAACLGVSAMLLASIRERRREIQLLRIIGAPPMFYSC